MANEIRGYGKKLPNGASASTGRTHLGVTTTIHQKPSLAFDAEHNGGIHVYWERNSGVEISLGPVTLGSNKPQNLDFTLEGTVTELQRAWDTERGVWEESKDPVGTLEERWAEFLVEQTIEVGIWFTKGGSPGGQYFMEEVDRQKMKEMKTIYAGILYYAVHEHMSAFNELRRIFEEGTTS